MEVRIQSRAVDGVIVLSCHGPILYGKGADNLRKTVKAVLGKNRNIVLNLGGVSYMDSHGLGTLAGLYSSAEAAGGEIKLCNLTRRMVDLLQVAQLRMVFEVYDTEEQAVAAFLHGAA